MTGIEIAVPSHGTSLRYHEGPNEADAKGIGCRCDPCRAANASEAEGVARSPVADAERVNAPISATTSRYDPVRARDIDAFRTRFVEMLEERQAQAGWRRHSACQGLDPSIFFPERGDNKGVEAAMAVCAECAVRDPCLQANLNRRVGIVGHTTAAQRRRLRRARRRAAVSTGAA